MAAAPDDDFPPLVAQEAVAPSELPNPKPAWGAPRAVSLRESLRESAKADQGGSGSSAAFSHGSNAVSSGADVASGGKPASGSSADPAPRGQIPFASGTAASGAVQCLVVDANVLILGTASLQKFASEAEIVTVREVLAEVRDRTARQQLSVLPFDIKCREPSDEAIKEGTSRSRRGLTMVGDPRALILRFARATGDVGTLSAVDSKLLALAVTEEIRFHGRANLRAAPARPVFQKRTNVAMRQALPGWGAENVANPDEWAGIDAVADDGGRGKGVGGSRILGVRALGEVDENAEGEEEGEEAGEGKAGEEAGKGEAGTGGNGGAESVEAGLQQMSLGGNGEAGEAGEGGGDGARKGGEGRETEQAVEMPGVHVIVIAIHVSSGPDDIRLRHAERGTADGPAPPLRPIRDAHRPCAQVSLQVKIQVHRWVQRCSACSAVTPDMTRVFCPDCGNGTTLNKVTVTVGVDGVVHAGVRKRHNIRGSKFSLPMPKGGRTGAAKDPVLREDQLLPKNGRRRFTQKKGKPTDVLAPDFVTFFDEVGEGKGGGGGAVNSRAVVATIAAGGDTRRMAVALGMKVNPNRVKRGGKK
ncbi:unnamed protein product [Closterium sp. Yama58-4]|nr:unnamed protein product [Closterium sp. Yama58-4]